MKVFALGGYGKVGLAAIKLLAQSDLVTEIAIVGRSLERAEKAATEIGEKAIAVHAEGTDEQKLTLLLAGYDIIVNAATNEAVLPAIGAATCTGTHYCDVASFGDFRTGAGACIRSRGRRHYRDRRNRYLPLYQQSDGSARGAPD
jgi:saccharopine dehydrogenase-like NADP-dependent oxidoreductase